MKSFPSYEEFPLNEDFKGFKATSITTSTAQARKKRVKPCSNCKKRKTRCFKTSSTQIKCNECMKRNDLCSYDEKVGERTCDNCVIRRTNCFALPNQQHCYECSLRNVPCTYSSSSNISHAGGSDSHLPLTDYDTYQGPTMLKKNLSVQGAKSSKIMGGNSLIEKNLVDSDHIQNFKKISDFNQYSDYNSNSYFFNIITDNDQLIKLRLQQLNNLDDIVKPDGSQLVDLYFKHVHPFLPIISKPVFMEKYKRDEYKEFDPLLLNMIYLTALKYWHLDPTLQTKTKPSLVKLENFAIILCDQIINIFKLTQPKISHCQSLVLMINYEFQTIESDLLNNRNWLMLNKLIGIVEELGLNYNSDDWVGIPDWEKKFRKILSWCIVKYDKFLALIEFKSSRIVSENWLLNELEFNDFDSKEDIVQNLIFVKMIHLSYHINDLLIEDFNLRSMKFDDFKTIYSKSLKSLGNLAKWYESLPEILRSFHQTPSPLSLNLSYYLVNILIFRRLINQYLDNNEPPSLVSTASSPAEQNSISLFESFVVNQILPRVKTFSFEIISNLTLADFTDNFNYSYISNATVFTNYIIVLKLVLKIYKNSGNYKILNQFNEFHAVVRNKITMFAENNTEFGRVLTHLNKFIDE